GEWGETRRIAAAHERIATLAKGDAFGPHPICEPVMLVEADAGGKREVWAHAHKCPAPVPIEQVEVVLNRPPPFVLEMPAVVFTYWHRHSCRRPRFHDN